MATEQPALTPSLISQTAQRHFLAVFFISFMWGTFGVDRFYLGKFWTGLLKLLTFGGFGVWVIVDLWLIMTGAMRDKHGREMLEVARYKAFAAKTVLIFAVVLGVVMLVSGAAFIYAVYNLVTSLMNGGTGGIEHLLPAGTIPDLNSL